MGVFRRRSAGQSGRDPHLPFLTEADADHIRALMRERLAERGREVTVHGGFLRDDQGSTFGLWNVASACHADPRGRRAWAAVVAAHLDSLLPGTGRAGLDGLDGLDGLTEREFLARVHAKLIRADTLPHAALAYAREPLPGLLEVLVLDLPEATLSLTDQDVERFGGAVQARAAGLANLRALPLEERRHARSPDGWSVDVLTGQSVYTASRALVMSHLLAHDLGLVDAGAGALAVLPGRNQLAVHIVEGRSMAAAAQWMAAFALAGYREIAGPLSPDVHWWHEGAWQRIAAVGPDGEFAAVPAPELVRLVRELDPG